MISMAAVCMFMLMSVTGAALFLFVIMTTSAAHYLILLFGYSHRCSMPISMMVRT